ncbi:MAG TPA: choice-of-anchor J domain-containing protein, partial [Candidatus Cloacimonadota bacterium]|nr:choice-of-anchor J domain-containing protein [Candidatus Cloacimonadota bacterium]
MKRTLLVVMLFAFSMMMAALWAVNLTEGFEGTTVPPTGWTMSYADPTPPAGNQMVFSTTFAHSGTQSFRFSSLSSASNDQYDQYLVTPQLNTTVVATCSFWYHGNTSGTEVFKVGWSTTTNNPSAFTWSSEISVPTSNTNWNQYVKNDLPIGTQYVAIHYYSDYLWYLYVDDVNIYDNPTIDMAAASITGNSTPSVGAATPYTVVITNAGVTSASGYTVKLMQEGGTELVSVAGTTLASGQSQNYILNWTPTTMGATAIYGKVVMTGDTFPNNDETAHLAVNVQAAGTTAITIGTGTATLNTIPIDMFYKSSISETIYPSTAINIGGQLTGLSWYNNFVTATLQNKPTKIWVGETTQTDLTSAWIPSTQLTSVFDGTVNYPAGQNLVTITFTTPYTYSGGNLVIMANRPLDTAYFSSSDMFLTSTGGAGCTREYHNDTTAPDPTAPPAGNIITSYPNVTLYFLAGGGFITGTVTAGGNPLAGATVHATDGTQTATTDASGVYHLNYVPAGTHPVVADKHGYTPVTQNVTVTEGNTVTQNFTLALLPQVTVTGHVVANTAPTVGIQGATINLTGYEPYSGTTNASGDFSITGVFANQTYNYTVAATGFQPTTGQVVVGSTNVNMGTLMVTEVMFPASQVVATDNGSNVGLVWQAPNPNAITVTEDFEGATFPSEGWTQVITETGAANTYGVYPTWCRFGNVALTPAVPPHGGAYQGGLWWSYNHQDEWLITPQFVCPPSASVNFWTWVEQGSTNGDHYYVKISTDNGSTWTVLWDASALPALENAYVSPYSIDLGSYSGQQVKLAWQAVDGDGQGLWYIWFIDDIYIGAPGRDVSFKASDFITKSYSDHSEKPLNIDPTMPTSVSKDPSYRPVQMPSVRDDGREVIGYRVYRLHVGEEATSTVWTTLTPTTITSLTYTDEAWGSLPTGDYKWAVRAVYTGEALANAAFSNHLMKTITGTISGVVTSAATGNPVSGATVTAGTSYTATTNASGAYSITLPTGTYTVTCSANGFNMGTQSNVIVNASPAITTVNFQLAVSNIIYSDGFETYPDFAVEFAPWILNDVDGSTTYGMTGVTWTGTGTAQAFMVFNPTTTTPPITTGGEAHGGTKYAACFAATTPPNNDWLIMRRVHLGPTGSLTFWARSYVSTYGLERFKVGVSTTGTLPANFTIITAGSYVEAPVAWTQYTYDLASYANQDVYIGVNCVSSDAFIFLVDDFAIDSPGGYVANNDPIVTPVVTSLDGNYPNPFNPTTLIKYSVKQNTHVSIDIYNIKGQKVKSLVNDVVNAGSHTAVW